MLCGILATGMLLRYVFAHPHTVFKPDAAGKPVSHKSLLFRGG